MKKLYLILVICIILPVNEVFSQDVNGLYFVVKSEDKSNEENVLGKVIKSKYFDNTYFAHRDSVIIFNAYLKTSDNPILRLWHFYLVKPKLGKTTIDAKDQHKVYYKDSSFLSFVDCIYWDDIKDMKRIDFKEYIGPELRNKMPNENKMQRTIYLVDLAEKEPNGKIKIYQVEDVIKQWHTGPHIEGEEERAQYMKTVREKIDKRRAERKAEPFKK